MREPFAERLEKRIVVCDGAMGTMLYAKGISLHRPFDELNLTAPHLVKEVHVGYIKAGAEVLETNTFGANRARLGKADLSATVSEINLAGARIAREVAGDDFYVAGAIGPLGVRLEPLGPTSLAEAREIFREQAEALAAGGVDLLLIETMTDLREARQALDAALEVRSRRAGPASLPIVVQMTIQEDGSTPTGTAPEEFARELDRAGADVIGINCSVGPAAVLEALERVAKATARKLSAMPNAGLPRTVEGRNLYLCSPEYMADYAKRFIQAGARLVGGCCGTTPDHIRAIKAAVRSMSPQGSRVTLDFAAQPARAAEPVPLELRSRLAGKLARREFPVLVEIVPPKGADATKEIEGARYVAAHGVDAVNIPDGAGATARMTALALAALLEQRVGVETLLHYGTRDRNVLTIQSDLLGAHALGLRNVLALTRDAAQYSTVQETALFEVDAIGLVNIVGNLNRGLDVGGNPLGTHTSFLIGVSANQHAVNMEEELRRFEFKVEAGANFAVTQPVFDVGKLRDFLKRIERFGLPVVASLWPLTSFRNAEFMNNEVPGVTIPPAVMERMRRADSGDAAREQGVRIAQETLAEIRDLVQGVQIASPFGRTALAVEVAQALPQKVELRSRK